MTKESMARIRAALKSRPPIQGLQAAVWKELEPLRRALETTS